MEGFGLTLVVFTIHEFTHSVRVGWEDMLQKVRLATYSIGH